MTREIVERAILWLLVLTAAAILASALGGCCKTCPPPRIVVETRREPCLDEPLLRDFQPVAEPAACDAGKPLEKCLEQGCLPGKICYEAKEHGALLFNVKTLITRAEKAEDLCLKK